MFMGFPGGNGSKQIFAAPPASVIPNAANCLAYFDRVGPFYQDTAMTTLATIVGQPVKAWADLSGNNKHAIWQSGPVPTLATGGGIDLSSGASLISPALSSDNTWTWYHTSKDGFYGDNGVSLSDGTLANIIEPNAGGFFVGYGTGSSYNTSAIADVGTTASMMRGMSANGTAIDVFSDTASASLVLGNAVPAAFHLGTNYSSGFYYTGSIINAAFYSTTDNSATRTTVISYMSTH